jgi:hypothetical protein
MSRTSADIQEARQTAQASVMSRTESLADSVEQLRDRSSAQAAAIQMTTAGTAADIDNLRFRHIAFKDDVSRDLSAIRGTLDLIQSNLDRSGVQVTTGGSAGGDDSSFRGHYTHWGRSQCPSGAITVYS